jgi:predicted dienelactone hydrolase
MKWMRAAVLGCLALAGACSSSGGTGGGPGGSGSGGSSGGGSTSGTIASSGIGGGGGAGSGSASVSGGSGSSAGVGGSGSAGSGTSAGSTSGSGTGASSGTTPLTEVTGCAGAKLYQVPDDTSLPGPWPVGVKTVTLTITGGTTPVEVWYPATIGSDAGKSQVTYDLTSWLPASEKSKIPAADNKAQPCNCVRDLPIDTTHGPYPAVIFIHGTGSFRTASLSTMTQWASRGFIAVAADHPGLFLTDFLASFSGGACKGTGIAQSLSTDVDAEIAGLTNKTGGFSFLGSSIDMSRIGMGGHSQGASNAATFGSKPNVQVDIPLADLGGTVVASSSVRSALFMGGSVDSVVPYSSDTTAYSGSTSVPLRRVVGIAGGNHLDVIDLCMDVNNNGKTGIQVATMYGVCGASTLASLAKCGTLSPAKLGPEIVNYVTTAALEETLHCTNRDAAFSGLKAKYSQVSDFQHTP